MNKSNYSFIITTLVLLFIFIPATAHAKNSNQVYEVGADSLNVRKSPNHNAEVIGHVKAGEHVTAFQEKNGWIQTYYGGQTGWVASQYLYKTSQPEQATETANTLTITKDAVHMRTGPGTNHTIIGFAANGDTFNHVKTEGDWHQINLDNGTQAWIASWLTDKPTKAEEPTINKEASTDSEPDNITDTSNDPSSETNESNESLSGYNIMLDAGHGGKDPGSIGINGEEEQDLTLQFTQAVADKLQNDGATVLLTRSANSYVSLQDRMRINDAYTVDAFISLHFNAALLNSANGISTHYYEDGPDQQLAQSIQNALKKHTSLKDRGVRQDNYHVLRENNTVSTLVELGFITNPYDLQVIKSSQNPEEVADAIAEGLRNYLN